MKRLKQKLKSSRGMSLGELLCAVLILTLVSGGMASAVSLGVRQYQQSIRTSEAKILCSTLETILRNELAYVYDIKMDGTNVKQIQSQNYGMKGNLSTLTTDEAGQNGYGHIILANCEDTSEYMSILGEAAYTNGLLAKIDLFSYENHCFTVKLSVGYDGETYATRTFQVLHVNYKLLNAAPS